MSEHGGAVTGQKVFRRILVASTRSRQHGLVVAGSFSAACALGRAGIGRMKREGDGTTPAGRFRIAVVLYRPDRVPRPATLVPVASIGPDSGWCDDPADRAYNRPVDVPYPGRYERLWRHDHLYDLVAVLDFNLLHPKRGAGSAVFVHIARPDFAPTEGCVAMGVGAMRRLLARTGPHTFIDIR
jgi:L,D-peptidoglycan transpeptidase YkuD (ErfK/YbiS/YcfS/YnhG family)